MPICVLMPGRLLSLPPSGAVEPVDIEVAMKREVLRRSSLPKHCMSSGLDGRLSVTAPDPMSASKDGAICLSFVFSEM